MSLVAYVAEDGLIGHHWEERPLGLTNFICPSTGVSQGQEVGVNGKKTAFSTNGAGTTGGYHVEECELIHFYLLVLRSNLSGFRNST